MTRSETAVRLPALIVGATRSERVGPGARPQGAATGTDAGYAAQSLGQDGVRRGLKGGAPVLTAARSAYLCAEWSGADDRRASPGTLRRTTA